MVPKGKWAGSKNAATCKSILFKIMLNCGKIRACFQLVKILMVLGLLVYIIVSLSFRSKI